MRRAPSPPWRALVVAALPALSAVGVDDAGVPALEERVIATRTALGFGASHANNSVGAAALGAGNPMVDVLSRLNRLPGVIVTQGDAVGGNDWSTRIYIRGMANGTDTAEIGYMVDGLPNGDSVYGGGQKPGAFVDHENVTAVQVRQHAGGIDTASNSALGAAIRYTTADPLPERGARLAHTGGEYGLRRWYLRADSGEVAPGLTAYASVSDSSLRSWLGAGSGRFDRRHVDLKVAKRFARGTTVKLKAAWNHVNETDYNSITLAEFRANPKSDRLLDEFDIDTVALWRPGWGGTRWNESAAVEVLHDGAARDAGIRATPYIHRQRGWGWWVPPYRVATEDGRIEGREGAAEFYQGTFLRDAAGALVPAPNASVVDHPCLRGRYPDDVPGYAVAPAFACAGAERVASRRRSGYWNERLGVTGEAWAKFGRHTLSAGLWLERQERDNNRQWFDLDPNHPSTLKPAASALHWTHFDRSFDTTTERLYVADRMRWGAWELNAGLVHHTVRSRYGARLDGVRRGQSEAVWLPRFGVLHGLRPGVELFAHYARNVLMLADALLAAGATGHLRPELSDNVDVGARWQGARGGIGAQLFAQRVEDRLGAVNLAAIGGDLYLQDAIEVLNVGGVASRGVEFAATFRLSDAVAAYGAYSHLRATYNESVPADGIVAGNRLVNAPRHQWFGELVWRPKAGWRLAVNARHVGDRPADLANSAAVPAYTLVGLDAAFEVRREGRLGALGVRFNASNVTNERYLAAPDGDQGGTFFLGPARLLSLTLQLEL